jgi:hypothetical protein
MWARERILGENINIWNDSWVPSIPSRKIITPRGDIVYT